jgi:hypothetical protein
MGTQKRGQNVGTRAEIDRRQGSRVDVPAHVAAQVRPANVPIAILNVSEGGWLMQSPINYPVGQTLEFGVTVAHKDSVLIRGRVVHTIRTTAGDVTSYVTGVEFVDRGTPGCDQALASLFGKLA